MQKVLVSMGVVALFVAGLPSLAQAQPTNSPDAAAADRKQQAVLEEVLVYARRRQELLQETPVAVSAFTGDQLAEAGIHNILELQRNVPSLSVSEDGSKEPKFFIRGIGSRSGGTIFDPGVGIYLNEILIPRPISQLLETVEVESVQVLRGPQGTLFGKNNTGGAILFRTRQPNVTELGGEITARLGNYGRRDVKLAVNVPLVRDSLAVRAAYSRTQFDGFLGNTVDGGTFGDENREGVSLRLLWEAADNFSADIFGFWSKTDEFSQGPTCVFQNPDASLPNLVFPAQPNYADTCRESQALGSESEIAINKDLSVFQVENAMLALTLNWSITENLELKSITGYSEWRDIMVNDDSDGSRAIIVSNGSKAVNETLAGSGFATPPDDRWQLTQEFQLGGVAFGSRLQYTVGVFASRERMDSVPGGQLVGPGGIGGVPFSFATNFLLPIPGFSDAIGGSLDENSVIPFAEWLGSVSHLKNESIAVFGEFTLDITEWLQLTMGGRYTTETRERSMDITEVDTDELGMRLGAVYMEPFGLFTPIPKSQFDAQINDPRTLPVHNLVTIGDEKSFDEFTPSATLTLLAPGNWLETMRLDSFMTYFTASKGFKAGGIDAKGQELVTVEPEFVTNLEWGFKLDAVQHRFRFNAAFFRTEWTDMQIEVNELGDSISGTEILQFLDNVSASTVVGAEIEASVSMGNWYVQLAGSVLEATFDDFQGQSVTPFFGGETPVDRSDEDFFTTPEKSASLSLRYDWLTDIGMVIPRLGVSYRSEVYTGMDFLAASFEGSTIDPVTLVDARLIWQPLETFQMTAFVDNLTDEYYFTSGFSNTGALGAGLMIQGKRRTYGLEMAWEF